MSRAESVFSEELAERAKADLRTVDRNKVAIKLKAIIAGAKYPVGVVADIMGVARETIWRWATAYRKTGLNGLYPKSKKTKPSKLAREQKEQVLQWLDEAKTPEGKHAHWTLEKLRHAIAEEFGVALGINTIWTWLRKEGRKPKVPRPRHYEADKQAQDDFKTFSPCERPSRDYRVLFRRRSLRPTAQHREALGAQRGAFRSESKDRIRIFLRLQRGLPNHWGGLDPFPALCQYRDDEHLP
jgi:transposase